MSRDLIAEMHAARQRVAALKAEKTKLAQAEARTLHEARKAAHRAETRAGYAGSDAEFDRLWRETIEPAWQREQLTVGGVAGSVQQLLSSRRYSGF